MENPLDKASQDLSQPLENIRQLLADIQRNLREKTRVEHQNNNDVRKIMLVFDAGASSVKIKLTCLISQFCLPFNVVYSCLFLVSLKCLQGLD